MTEKKEEFKQPVPVFDNKVIGAAILTEDAWDLAHSGCPKDFFTHFNAEGRFKIKLCKQHNVMFVKKG